MPPEAIRHYMDEVQRVEYIEPECLREPTQEPPALRYTLDVDVVQKLPEFDRVVVLAVYWGNLSHRATARHMGCARDTILASLERSMKAIRAIIRPEQEEALDG